MKLLDTSFLVDYLRSKDYTLSYLKRNEDEVFYASSLTMFELYRGEIKTDGSLERLEEDLEWLKEDKIDKGTAKEAAKIEESLERKGKKINLADVLIAGTAKKTGAEIVTGDSDFNKIDEIESNNPQED